MLRRPHSLTLITTHQCTAACDDCCFGCTPRQTRRIPHERLLSLIEEAAALRSIRTIAFSGGECFLLGEELDELVAHATRCGLSTCCITNGYWAVSPQAAQDRIARLAQAGLKELRLSTGAFHCQYVPTARVVHGASASVSAGLKTRVKIETAEARGFDFDSILQSPVLKPLISRRRVKVDCGIWVKRDGNGAASPGVDRLPVPRSHRQGCPSLLNQFAVTPDEILVACCGLHLERIPELHLGSLRTASLAQLIREAPDDFLKIWMHVEGPHRIWEFVRRHAPGQERPPAAVHPCEACLHLHQDKAARQVIRDHAGKVQRKIRLKYLAKRLWDGF